jgi:tRNA(Arg) A34 adenosine deaminase TadA
VKISLNEKQKKEFMAKASSISQKSLCGYKIGCVGVIEKENFHKNIHNENINFLDGFTYLKTWNETIKGEMYCQNFDEKGNRLCIREIENLKGREFHKVCSVHAEVNLIAKCAKYGIKTDGMILFVTNSPCYICAKSIIQSGIKEIYYQAEHTDTSGIDLLKRADLLIEKLTL